ncbi:MAG TPA: DUF3592 domain-containing protein [Planctomycetaceae bacterium]|nr:DUF3592 domain-containing protein [Planctomycetaceae bacterium]
MPDQPTPALSLNRRRSSGLGGCVGVVFFGIFFGVGSVFLFVLTIQPLWGVLSAGDWVETPCTVVSSEVVGDGDAFRVRIVYRYTFAGRPFTGERYHFMGDFSSSGRAGKQQVVDRYPPGLRTVCYVDPDDPQQAVLNRGLTSDMWWGLFPLPFVAIGTAGLVSMARSRRKAEQPAGPVALSARGAGGRNAVRAGRDAAEDDDREDGPFVLKPEASPLGKFIGAVFVACFWNGIVSVFLYQVYQGFERGRPEWCLTVFLTPFVAVGAGLAVWAVYSFLALFNPRPVLTLSRRRIPLGGAARLAWKFSGSTHAIRRLKVTLRGQEQATYVRGTTTHTDTQTFHEGVLWETEDPLEITEGQAEAVVPDDSMHSFAADNNKIVWSIVVAGEIPLRPDVDAEFPIQVTPHEPHAR